MEMKYEQLENKPLERRSFLKKSAAAICGAATINLLDEKTFANSNVEYDILIVGGLVFDGTGNPPFRSNIGIKGERIVSIGNTTGTAETIIEADDYIVTPGFIDVHTHCDLTFKRSGWKRHLVHFLPSFKGNYNYLYQGVTTVVTGNCGYGYTNVDWWLSTVDSVEFGTNVFHLCPHGAIRQELFGDKQPQSLTSKQLQLLKYRVEEAMEMGAMGLSTGLEYYPGLAASTSELIELSRIVSKFGGVYVSHRRDQTGRLNKNGEFGTVATTREAVEIGRKAGIGVQLSHLSALEPLNGVRPDQVLYEIDKALESGIDVTADVIPYAKMATTLKWPLPDHFKSSDGVKDEYKTGAGRVELKQAVIKILDDISPDKIHISVMVEGNTDFEGKSLRQISEMEGKDPVDTYIHLVSDVDTPFSIISASDPSFIPSFYNRDYIMTCSDGWTVPKDMTQPHPRCYGAFPQRLVKYTDRQNPLDFSRAIRSMTSLPAEKFRMEKRGKIKKGYFADIAIINPNQLKVKATYRDPHQYSSGIEHLLVNGTLSIQNGTATGNRAGKGIRKT